MLDSTLAAVRRTVDLGPRPRPILPIGFGAEALGRTGRTLDAAAKTLHAVLDGGIELVDTASCYGRSEEFIGAICAERGRPPFIVTKCGWSDDLAPAWSPDELRASVERSLTRLRVEALDVVLLHSCPLDVLIDGAAIETLEALRDAGIVGSIGYSGDGDSLAWAIRCGRFGVVEATVNLLDRANLPLLAEAATAGLVVLAKRPLANAVPGRSEAPRSPYAAQYWDRWVRFEALWRARRAPLEPGAWRSISLRWALHAPGVRIALVGSSHAEHVLEHLEAAALGPLEAALRADLDACWELLTRTIPTPALG